MKLLIVDDEENMCHMLKAMVERHGYQVTTSNNGKNALQILKKNHFDFVLCDLKMPVMDGLTFLEKGNRYLQDSTVIMMSAFGSIDLAITAMKAGAYDFISKPFKSDEVLLAFKKAEERESLKQENRRLKAELKGIRNSGNFYGIVGESGCIKKVYDLIAKVGPYSTTVLITGESGTGKELVARALHECSDRKDRPFFAVNCGSIPNSLLESELFGYVKGAFTGADHNKNGLFIEADGSTVFLDEISELPLEMQVKLLRVLQEQEISVVGSSSPRRINVRVVAATARDLSTEVKSGKFREDLFYRLNVINIAIPTLLERKEDIPLLCQHFIKKFNNRFKTSIQAVSPDAMKVLLQYSWPGNIRELENAIQRGVVLTRTDLVEKEQLPSAVVEMGSVNTHDEGISEEGNLSLKDAQKRLEAKLISLAMRKFNGNKSKAASSLRISYPSMLSKLKEYNIG